MIIEQKSDNSFTSICLYASIVSIIVDIFFLVSRIGNTSETIAVMLFCVLSIILVPTYVLSFVGFPHTFFHNGTKSKQLRFVSIANILFVVVLFFTSEKVGAEEMERDYQLHQSDIENAINFTYSVLSDGCSIDVEFDDKQAIEHLFVGEKGSDKLLGEWNPTSFQVDSLTALIGITQKDLYAICNYLRIAGCYSIAMQSFSDKNYMSLLYRRHLSSAYYFEVFEDDLSDDEILKMNDASRIIYDKKVCFRYGSPAWGDVGFPGKEKYLKSRKRRVIVASENNK